MKKIFYLFLLLGLLTACTSNYNRGSLSDALNKSKNKNAKDRHVRGNKRDSSDNDSDNDTSFLGLILDLITSNKPDSSDKIKGKSKKSKNIKKDEPVDENFPKVILSSHSNSSYKPDTLKASSGYKKAKNSYTEPKFSYKINYETGGFKLAKYNNLKGINFLIEDRQTLKKSVVHGFNFAFMGSDTNGKTNFFSFGYHRKKYFSKPHNFLNPYAKVNFKVAVTSWRFENSIYSDNYDEDGYYENTTEIDRDTLWGGDFSCGFGVNIFNSSKTKCFIEFSPGVVAWLPETSNGFNNDEAPSFFYFKIGFGIGFY